MIYTHAAAGLVGAALAAVAAWHVQGWRMDAQLSQLKTQYATAQAQAVEKAHAETIRLQDQKSAAERMARARIATLATDAAGARDALVSLSDAADGALRAASDSHSACMANASTLRVVFGECSQRRNEVAADAQGHLIDKQTLTEAWPK